MSIRHGLLIALAIVAIVGLGVGGYALGRSQAPDEEEATAQREAAYDAAYESSLEQAAERSRERGVEEGQAAGQETGERRGNADGDSDAEAELADIAAAEAAAAEQAAAAEARERAANCGAPLFPDDVCPTDEQIAQEQQAESLCGPGTAAGREQAAELGIQC